MPFDDLCLPETVAPVVPRKQGTLVMVGFYGRGNAGDEAMLQVVFASFAARFNIMLCVDECGAYPQFWDWYPYNRAKIAHQNHLHIFEVTKDPVGVLVGGGSLPLGFGAGHALVGSCRNVPAALAGVDLWQPDPNPDSRLGKAYRTYLGLFDRVIVRTERSLDATRTVGMEAQYGGDWALRLETDAAPDIEDDPQRVLVVVREEERASIGADYRDWIERLLRVIEARGYRPVFLPFSPGDEAFLRTMDLTRRAPVERAWWNAQRLKQFMANSALTVTVGRLHPIIFAAPTGRAVTVVRPPHWVGALAGATGKLRDMANELGVSQCDTIEDFVAGLEDGRIGPADPVHVEAATARVDAALAALHALFRPYGDGRT